jgi:hypothetical protein
MTEGLGDGRGMREREWLGPWSGVGSFNWGVEL